MQLRRRSIPAYAGDPRLSAASGICTAVYPRLRGGSCRLPVRCYRAEGLSPPTRGILGFPLGASVNIRSIPAYAGDPANGLPIHIGIQVYPRLRGGSDPACIMRAAKYGLSPPTRGIPIRLGYYPKLRGSIPAYAGDPSDMDVNVHAKKVYPRLRGGSAAASSQASHSWGLSPPTRGIPCCRSYGVVLYGSIPAYAGDPRCPAGSLGMRPVYPRLRGGSKPKITLSIGAEGLSPPTRGIRRRLIASLPFVGSIPAYAGDPLTPRARRRAGWVYPRLRGGSGPDRPYVQGQKGLSPPTRGIPPTQPGIHRAIGSIPAYAGDPACAPGQSYSSRVYPRLRGGSEIAEELESLIKGLSPPTRGIRLPSLAAAKVRGSIPAYAGDPCRKRMTLSAIWVYPRLRGGSE